MRKHFNIVVQKEEKETMAIINISSQSNNIQEYQPYSFPSNINNRLSKLYFDLTLSEDQWKNSTFHSFVHQIFLSTSQILQCSRFKEFFNLMQYHCNDYTDKIIIYNTIKTYVTRFLCPLDVTAFMV